MTAQPERILYLINAFESDAPNRVILSVAEAASSKQGGYECLLVALSRGGDFASDAARHGIARQLVGMRSLLDLSWGKRLRKIICEFRPHIFHASLTRPTLLGVPVAASCGVPRIVITQHGTHEWGEGGKLASYIVPTLFRSAAARSAAVVTVSEYTRRQIVASGVEAERTRVIPNGVDTERFHPSRREARARVLGDLFGQEGDPERLLLVGAAGNLRQIKGQRTMVEAAARVADEFPQARFVLWGEGPERAGLEALVKEKGLSERFLLPGRAQDIAGSLAACDVFVQPSLEESFGLAAAEAMSCAVAVISSQAGGLPELVEDGRSGLLFATGSARALAANLSYLLGRAALRQRLGTEARRRIQSEFSIERMTSRYLQLYAQLVHRAGNTGVV